MTREDSIRNLIDYIVHNPDHGITYFSDEPCKFHLTDGDGKPSVDEDAVYGWDIMDALGIKEA